MNKKSCFGLGCTAVLLLVLIASVAIWKLAQYGEQQKKANQKPVREEILAPAGVPLQEGIAVSIVVDTSGSMDSRVRDAENSLRPKIQIARKTAAKTLEQLAKFAAANPGKTLRVGLVQFNHKIHELAPMSPLDVERMTPVVESLNAGGGTAIGEAMIFAKQQLNKAALTKQNIIVITDGENTSGREPLEVVTEMQKLPAEQRPALYLVAFDVEAKTFKPLTDAGTLVLEARDAAGLQGALDYILYEKILVEQP